MKVDEVERDENESEGEEGGVGEVGKGRKWRNWEVVVLLEAKREEALVRSSSAARGIVLHAKERWDLIAHKVAQNPANIADSSIFLESNVEDSDEPTGKEAQLNGKRKRPVGENTKFLVAGMRDSMRELGEVMTRLEADRLLVEKQIEQERMVEQTRNCDKICDVLRLLVGALNGYHETPATSMVAVKVGSDMGLPSTVYVSPIQRSVKYAHKCSQEASEVNAPTSHPISHTDFTRGFKILLGGHVFYTVSEEKAAHHGCLFTRYSDSQDLPHSCKHDRTAALMGHVLVKGMNGLQK
ncbi:hypothetical protein R1flu_003503 [Riccia fluitans]|uniref:Uncharacterized protein n=1 Tax=Riccia fluitans TaxID=41844 RepID=A0ABD1Y9B3_9MARC